MNDLPSGWTICELEKCVDILDNQRIPVNSDERQKRQGNVPYFGATGQVGWIDDYLFDEELVLIGEDGAPFFDKSKPIAYIIDGKAWVNNHAHVLRAKSEITSNLFLKWFLDLFDFHGYVNGTTRLKLNQGAMKPIPVLLPPLNEQKRIVEKLEKLLGKVEAAQERLDKIPVILKRFRQSILAAACSGKLTADWREDKKEDSDTGFPIGWELTKLGTLFPKGGIFDGPFGSNLKSSDYTQSGVRVVRLENVGHLRFLGKKKTFVNEEKYETLKRHTVGEGDIIFASFIADEIRACILPDLPIKAIAKADCFCLRPNDDVDRKYLLFQLVNRKTYDELVNFVHGATRPRINTTQLKTLILPMCPLDEQKEIVRRVEDLFKFADQIEERYKKARSYTDKLAQSILAKAFRGELVPQDPTDEPASELLERIGKVVNPRAAG